MIEDHANNAPSLEHILSPQPTNRSSSSLQIEPELIKVSSRRKRKYLRPQQLSTESRQCSVIEAKQEAGDDNAEEYNKQSIDNESNISEKSKSDSNKETKPGMTLQVEDEEDENQDKFKGDNYFYQLQQTRRMQRNYVKCQMKVEQSEQLEQSQDESEEEIGEKMIQNIVQKGEMNYSKRKPMLNKTIKNDGESINQPITQGYRAICVIQVQQSFVLPNKYLLYLNKPTGKQNAKSIISAKKQMLAISTSFIISTSEENHSTRSDSYIARLIANFSGTQWKLIGKQANNQILFTQYVSSFLGSKGLRELEAFKINREDQNYQMHKKIGLMNMVSSNKRKKKLTKISTARPKLDKGKYKLDFRGLAKVPSSKNLILSYQKAGQQQKQCLLLAKQTGSSYLMQVGYPLSLLQGFCLCLTSLNGKLLVN